MTTLAGWLRRCPRPIRQDRQSRGNVASRREVRASGSGCSCGRSAADEENERERLDDIVNVVVVVGDDSI